MLKKGSKLNSILTGTCPKCQNESMYTQKNPYYLGKILDMNEKCSHCGLRYQLEPSFFYGAMYVSYALNVAVGVAAFIIAYVFMQASLKIAFIAIIAATIVLQPVVLRLARNIYINMFVSYEKSTTS
ncbi:DUF983 domain-containing protein [Flavobacterium agrisoli]|uniref:DUF983 domain-containing protein n=1 Tax=Flavobacterium agrisoli TaxID=2793066 RepID=A0A934PNZ3_9FLAO|nr:DUF983 domain-containing protein [Flavobacterium agrisoli]MBK0370418.1 DUF983 domain-containing protein [Flavobacterium agrisoli]